MLFKKLHTKSKMILTSPQKFSISIYLNLFAIVDLTRNALRLKNKQHSTQNFFFNFLAAIKGCLFKISVFYSQSNLKL